MEPGLEHAPHVKRIPRRRRLPGLASKTAESYERRTLDPLDRRTAGLPSNTYVKRGNLPWNQSSPRELGHIHWGSRRNPRSRRTDMDGELYWHGHRVADSQF